MVQTGRTLVTYHQPAKIAQPGDSALHNPPVAIGCEVRLPSSPRTVTAPIRSRNSDRLGQVARAIYRASPVFGAIVGKELQYYGVEHRGEQGVHSRDG